MQKWVYKVAYKDWKGKWVLLSKPYKTRASAETYASKIAVTKALNGQTSVRKF